MKGRKRGLGPFVRFMETKGFYLVLGVCVLAVGVAGYLIFGQSDPAGNVVDREDVLNEGELEIPDNTMKDDEEDQKKEDSDKKTEDSDQQKDEVNKPTQQQKPDTPVNNPVQVPKVTYSQPVKGKVIRKFSGDTLVKDETMGDWRTHNGTDFACKKDAEAVAFADGTVLKVEERGLYGLCITIDHGDGLVSVLAGLASGKVKSGDKVTCGQAIGICAGNLEAESAQESHVHLEVTKAGKYIDPMSLISK